MTVSQLLSGKRVLVVEDEMLVLMAIEDMLADLGCTSVSGIGNIDAALGLIADNNFDLATLDLNLNGSRSYPVADALDARHIPFAFVTAYGARGVKQNYGDHPVLQKPYTTNQFSQVVSDLLDEGTLHDFAA